MASWTAGVISGIDLETEVPLERGPILHRRSRAVEHGVIQRALLLSCHLQVAILLTLVRRLTALSIHRAANLLVWHLYCLSITNVEVSRGISVTMASKSAISRSAHPETESNANMIRFLDEKRALLPGSNIPEGFRELRRFFPEIVIVSKSAVTNDGALKRAEPNISVTDLTKRTVDNHILRSRNKFEAGLAHPKSFHTSIALDARNEGATLAFLVRLQKETWRDKTAEARFPAL
jgi:hypothetical protein